MILTLFPELIWTQKIRRRQKRLSHFIYVQEPLVSLDDFLFAGNYIAVDYFNHNNSLLKRLWEYYEFDPKCGSYSTYTYGAFLSLTELFGQTKLQNDVRWAGGIYVSRYDSGHHAYLEKRVDEEWKPFETIPEMQDIPAKYRSWYTFQLAQGRCKVTSEMLFGVLAISVYGFVNS